MASATRQWLLKVFSGPHAGAEIVLTDGEHIVGSGDDCDIILDDPQIAPRHASLNVQGQSVTCTALDDANIYVEGQPSGNAQLKAFEYLTIGTTHLAVGPEGDEWPARELPTIQTAGEDAPAEEGSSDEESATSSEASEEKTETKASDAPSPAEPARTSRGGVVRWLVSLLVLILLVGGGIVVAASAGWFTSETAPVVAATKSDLEKIVQEVAPQSTVEIREDDGGFTAAGYVMERDTARDLEDALLDADAAIDIADIDDMEGIAKSVRGLLNLRKLSSLTVTAEKPGELAISGIVSDLSVWEPAKQELESKKDVKITYLVKDTEGKSLVAATPTVAPPPPTPESNPAEEEKPPMPPVEPVAEASPISVPLVVRDVTIGRSKFITTMSGNDVREGSIVRGGFIVKTIASDYVILVKDGEEVIVHFEVQQ